MGPRARGQGLTSDPVAVLRPMVMTQGVEVRGPVAPARRRLFARADMIAFVHNCTVYDLQDGTIDPAAFAQSTDIWALMGTPNPTEQNERISASACG